MKVWLDAQLSPRLAAWIAARFELEAVPVVELGLRDAPDVEIFRAAREADAVVMTKDADFALLLERRGPPPRVIWVTCGNSSNARMRQILETLLPEALRLLESGETLVEIGQRSTGA